MNETRDKVSTIVIHLSSAAATAAVVFALITYISLPVPPIDFLETKIDSPVVSGEPITVRLLVRRTKSCPSFLNDFIQRKLPNGAIEAVWRKDFPGGYTKATGERIWIQFTVDPGPLAPGDYEYMSSRTDLCDGKAISSALNPIPFTVIATRPGG